MLKSHLVYIAEDNKLDIDKFVDYCFKNHSQYVWAVQGIEYCHPNDAEFLVKDYKEFIRYED
jgi:hypothetical protein